MSIDVEIYQDSGPLLNGRGTTTSLINNIGWKTSASGELVGSYTQDTIVRPQTSDIPFTHCYDYYTFFKISGIYVKASRPRIAITGSIVGSPPTGYVGNPTGVRLFYRLAESYGTPTNTHDGDLVYYNNNNMVLYPKLSLTSPVSGLTRPQYLNANTTYYTQFLHTKVYVEYGTMAAGWGNIGELEIECRVDDYEESDT